ncbi:MAG: hypothetical protein HQ568_07325 [Calditrichaeota bacterium]|nr:hypothetical protein [Calditrichota bacterium]
MLDMRALRYCSVIALLILTVQLTTATQRGNQYLWGRNHELSWGRGHTKVFHPSDIAWSHYFSADYGVEADSSGTLADSGDVVFFWSDQSSNNYDAYQGANTNRPVFQTGVNGGNNGLLFDSNDDFLTVPGDDIEGEFTYWFVFSTSESALNSYTCIFGHNTGNEGGNFTFNRSGVITRLSMRSSSTNQSNFADLSQGDGSPHVCGVYLAGAEPTNRLNDLVYFDAVTKTRSGDVTGAAFPWSDLMIGHGLTFYGGFTLSEYGVYEGKMPEADRINIQNYWIKKYGIE